MLAQRRDHQGMVQGSLECPLSAWLVGSPSLPIWTNLGYRRNRPSGARAADKSVIPELVEKVPLAAAREPPDCLANHVPFRARRLGIWITQSARRRGPDLFGKA